jgi:hypothetical protein
MMLDLLETLRNLVLSGHEPASFLFALRAEGSPIMVSAADPEAEWPRLWRQYGGISLAFAVRAWTVAAGALL